MSRVDVSLHAHLMRRAGFGAGAEELEQLASRPYEEVVEDLLSPEKFHEDDLDVDDRYHGRTKIGSPWFYTMVKTRRPLVEKMALFCHHVFATGAEKSGWQMERQIDMFRRLGLGGLRNILVELSHDPAMIMWLDNNENFKQAPNENYGRELLELFSMGVGNYTEEDVKAATRAFTGWSFKTPIFPPNYVHWSDFVYKAGDHDDGPKTFLGKSGRFNGEDIVDLIVRQPATARFISRHLYTFFVADEPAVASWNETPPRDPGAIDILGNAYVESDGEFRHILRVLFNSDFFKESQFKRVKSPTEVVAGVVKLVGLSRYPDPRFGRFPSAIGAMGQNLMNPFTVEGWHTGPEWIDGGTLNTRVNFAVDELTDASQPGIREIVARLRDSGAPLPPPEFVDRCIQLAGPVAVEEDTRDDLLDYAESGGSLTFDTKAERADSDTRILRMLQLIVSTREYQFG